ncbi:variant erythrocyte surface antigen-1 family protein [Babesia caballi]|uniref:Variant erythrocyte surface antigen-1 family protein n=1 Tax=Babesia caballi TaxID=5871 RepID=A0AAV4LQQ9_BABCB|nr:variant erythrocyte surface antigen-1 family protein [Babesia caballi]
MVSGQKQKLTEWPENLREAIDWLALVGGGYGGNGCGHTGMYDELGTALKRLPKVPETIKATFNKDYELQSFIKNLADKLGKGFLGYISQGGTEFSDDGIIKTDVGYNSTFKEASWPKNGDQQTCALIFLGSATAVYYCIGYLCWRLKGGGGWVQQTVGGAGVYLNSFLLAIGYETNVLSTSGTGGDTIMENVANELDELSKTSDSASPKDYRAFLQKLEANAPTLPINHPLASCYKLATAYFEKQANASDINEAINKLNTKFEEFSQNSEITQSSAVTPNPYEPLKEPITQLLSAVQKFQPKEPEQFGQGVHHGVNEGGTESGASGGQSSSPAAPVAGTLTTLDLGGGAGAAYMLNLGGAKTLVNGLLRIG